MTITELCLCVFFYTPPPTFNGQPYLPYMDYKLDALAVVPLLDSVPTSPLPVHPNVTASSLTVRVSSEADPAHISSRAYNVRIASSDVQLLNVSFAGGQLNTGFDPAALSQTATFPIGTKQINITVVGRSPAVQTIAVFFRQYLDPRSSSGVTTTLPYVRTPTAIISVTADDGSQQNITMIVNVLLDGEARIASITPESYVLHPAFSPDTYNYTLSMPMSVQSLKLLVSAFGTRKVQQLTLTLTAHLRSLHLIQLSFQWQQTSSAMAAKKTAAC